ncbi:hypothetical protein VTL71DRAFT_12587 [Oculimacula yallundae]|uniref:DUF2256 domain-containing protein n=1 Tax=Oculimacula yallundae TaxID=86028 RepID=A0ABR4CNP0_9HELO
MPIPPPLQPPQAQMWLAWVTSPSLTAHRQHQHHTRAMGPPTTASVKICASCGRQISWRKKWEKNWDSITYCSDSCRKHKIKPGSVDIAFESKILALLKARRAVQGTVAMVTCEEAEEEISKERASISIDKLDGGEQSTLSSQKEGVGESRDPPSVLKSREKCRQAARRLASRGEIVITQSGKVVDPSFAKGVMELKFPSCFSFLLFLNLLSLLHFPIVVLNYFPQLYATTSAVPRPT